MLPEKQAREAYLFAAEAHERVGQKRKYTEEPYIFHPIAVANLVRVVPHDQDMVAAAFLHDVVEDTGTSFNDLRKAGFSERVVSLVYWLTDISSSEDGNRKERKAIDREHNAQAPKDAQTIKLADLIDNTQSIVDHDPGFARIYLHEKRLLLTVLVKGDPYLWKLAMGLVQYGESMLGVRNIPIERK